jgi:cysteine desulfurase/selenocysteine lyase
MTTPRPTAELVSAPHVPDAPELPHWLPDEQTLNRLAGEFFAAMPASVTGAGAGMPGAGGDVEQAPRVDVPARSSEVPAAPGSGGGGSPAPGSGAPGLSMTDPAAATGAAPARAIPDVSEAGAAFGSAGGAVGSPGPESAMVPGVMGLQLTPPGELTPPLHGIAAPLPAAGAPGLPASDQPATGGGLPIASVPDVSAAPLSTFGAITTPAVPPVPQVPGVTGATGVPGATGGPGEVGAESGQPQLQVPTSAPSTFGADLYRPPTSVGLPSVPQPPVAVPDVPAPVPTPSTPYYFVAESSPYLGDAGELDTLAAAALTPLQPPAVQPLVGATGPGNRPPDRGDLQDPAFYFVERPTGAGTERGLGRAAPFDVHQIRRDFPILSERVNGKPLVWLDNAATTQKPQAVLDRLAHFYEHENSNIHRAAHELAARATDAYEGARKKVARFIGASSEKNIVFVRGATEAINLVAKSWGRANIRRGDEIIVSHLEHHANIVPWQQLIAETGAVLRVIPVDDSGQLILSEYGRLLSEKTKLVSVTQVSNALGTVTPVDQIVEMGHRAGACVLIDGAQSVPHIRVNMQTLGTDFFVFSGHKIFGPTGIGVVYGRAEVLESMPPWEGGGNMIVDVTFEKTVFQHPPNRFEAGTGNIADAVGLGAALDYVNRVGVEAIAAYEHSLLEYATPRMLAVPGLHMVGTAAHKASVLSFVLDGYRTEEVGTALNQEGIAVRSGHHCAQPILRRFGVETTVRPSLAFYNTVEEIDLLVSVLHRLAAGRGRR